VKRFINISDRWLPFRDGFGKQATKEFEGKHHGAPMSLTRRKRRVESSAALLLEDFWNEVDSFMNEGKR